MKTLNSPKTFRELVEREVVPIALLPYVSNWGSRYLPTVIVNKQNLETFEQFTEYFLNLILEELVKSENNKLTREQKTSHDELYKLYQAAISFSKLINSGISNTSDINYLMELLNNEIENLKREIINKEDILGFKHITFKGLQ